MQRSIATAEKENAAWTLFSELYLSTVGERRGEINQVIVYVFHENMKALPRLVPKLPLLAKLEATGSYKSTTAACKLSQM